MTQDTDRTTKIASRAGSRPTRGGRATGWADEETGEDLSYGPICQAVAIDLRSPAATRLAVFAIRRAAVRGLAVFVSPGDGELHCGAGLDERVRGGYLFDDVALVRRVDGGDLRSEAGSPDSVVRKHPAEHGVVGPPDLAHAALRDRFE